VQYRSENIFVVTFCKFVPCDGCVM